MIDLPEKTKGFWPFSKPAAAQPPAAGEGKAAASPPEAPWSLRRLRLPLKQRLAFYDQIATLVGAGVTIMDALLLVRAQEKKKSIRALYGQMVDCINAGLGLAESMGRFPNAFPPMQVALVAAGEKSGNLKAVMSELVQTMESSEDFARKIKGAMFYPVILIVLALGLVAGMMAFVIPKIAQMYSEAGVALPSLTQAVIDLSDFVLLRWKILILGLALGGVSIWAFFCKTTLGRWLGESLVFGLPVAGRLSRERQLMMLCGNMGMLLSSGVLISDAFSIAQRTLGNLHYRQAAEELRQGVVLGKELSALMGLEDLKSQSFKEHPLFPLQVAQMMHIGESTGAIARMMLKVRDNYRKSIDYALKNISTVIEPLMIFFVAALVGSIVLAVMLPFFYIGDTIS